MIHIVILLFQVHAASTEFFHNVIVEYNNTDYQRLADKMQRGVSARQNKSKEKKRNQHFSLLLYTL